MKYKKKKARRKHLSGAKVFRGKSRARLDRRHTLCVSQHMTTVSVGFGWMGAGGGDNKGECSTEELVKEYLKINSQKSMTFLQPKKES